ncbi:MAG: (2Fe-2S)-binding protein, partial [Gammaproteobacteria bacterium]|nr:(2Fe-2S)-binding protein [Gammaproteobacteria bacterium]
MFKRIREPSSPVQIKFEDRVITADAHDTVAAALLAAGVLSFR